MMNSPTSPLMPDSEFFTCVKTGTKDELCERLEKARVDESSMSLGLKVAASFNRTEMVMLLSGLTDPKKDNSEALRWAAEQGATESLEFLIPLSDITALDFGAMRMATKYRRTGCIDALLPHMTEQQMKMFLNGVKIGAPDDFSFITSHIEQKKLRKKMGNPVRPANITI